MGNFMSDLEYDFHTYIETSIPAFLAVFIGVYAVSGSLGPTLAREPFFNMMGVRMTEAFLAGVYAILGNFIAQYMSHTKA